MRRLWLVCPGIFGLLFLARVAHAQTSLDVLEESLKEIKSQHEEASSQTFTNFIAGLDAAIASPDAAVDLYQKAGGAMPDAAPVQTHYEHETPDEKNARLAQDQASLAGLAYMVQTHCGLMRFAAFFVVQPDRKGLRDEWLAWLKTTAGIYPQLNGSKELRVMAVRDSIITKYFGFAGWGDKEQGNWAIKELPELYKTNILDPLRSPLRSDALAAWDTYIAMRGAHPGDMDKWNTVDSPSLQFERACDDFNLGPSTEKLSTIIDIIKANPTHPNLDDMLSRAHVLMETYRQQKTGITAPAADNSGATNAPAAPPSPPPS